MNLCHRYRTEEFLCGGEIHEPYSACEFFTAAVCDPYMCSHISMGEEKDDDNVTLVIFTCTNEVALLDAAMESI